LLTACGSNPSGTSLDGFTLSADENDAPPPYSELTRKETEETLKRLQVIRKTLGHDQSGVYTGPIRHVWDRIQAKPMIQYDDNLRIEKQATVLLRDNKYVYRVSLRSKPYIYYILEEIDKRGLPRELALLPVIESAYRPTAYSRSRAAGLWQFIPSTSRFLGMKTNWWYDARRDVITSTQYALDYLQTINKKFDGDWLLTLAAYNAGHGRISRAIARNKKKGKPTDYWSLKLPTETMNYVPRFLATSRIFTRPDDYQVSLYPVANKPHLEIVNIESQLDLKLAAEMAGMTPAEIKTYNPGFLRWTTDPNGPHRLVLPIQKRALFDQKFAALDKSDRLRWTEHRVRKGETLSGIATRHGIRVSVLKSSNQLKGSLIRVGQVLQVPLGHQQKAGKRQAALTTVTVQNGYSYYTVKSGDTLWQIARTHKVTTQSLLALNNLRKNSILQPGQKIKIRRTSDQVALKS
jgi:membrane-bound lytic murein transglycosylase D